MEPNGQTWTGPRARAPVHQLHQLPPDAEPLRRDAEDRRARQARGLTALHHGVPLLGRGLPPPAQEGCKLGPHGACSGCHSTHV
eukprot:4601146-Alexandrium_andersonii.AAC.1